MDPSRCEVDKNSEKVRSCSLSVMSFRCLERLNDYEITKRIHSLENALKILENNRIPYSQHSWSLTVCNSVGNRLGDQTISAGVT